MGANTKIEWANHTFNPWLGCTRVSPACDHCYAASWAKRIGRDELWNGERQRTSAGNWNNPIKWDAAAKAAGERPRVFCASLADVFDNQVPGDWRHDLWVLIAKTPNLDWLLLTKRPQNIAKMLPRDEFMFSRWPWPNVWLGTTVENQEEANRRIPHLLQAPVALRFLSCEPLLGPIDLTRLRGADYDWYDCIEGRMHEHPSVRKIDWVIVGGESGPHARPMHPDWARGLRDQCAAADTPFFFKQWGAWVPVREGMALDYDSHRARGAKDFFLWKDSSVSERFSKSEAGRLLDGREHNEFPEAA